jgi:hypothetical protein
MIEMIFFRLFILMALRKSAHFSFGMTYNEEAREDSSKGMALTSAPQGIDTITLD